MRTCGICYQPKAEDEFYVYYSKKRGVERRTSSCKECMRFRKRANYQGLKIVGQCLKCPEMAELGHVHCKACLDKLKADRLTNIELRKAKELDYRRKVKLEALEAYGGPVCVCCGETLFEFLTLDHPNNDGAEHRRRLPKGTVMAAWLKARGYPPGFQVMCMNCNFAKGHYGMCPHQKGLKLVLQQ